MPVLLLWRATNLQWQTKPAERSLDSNHPPAQLKRLLTSAWVMTMEFLSVANGVFAVKMYDSDYAQFRQSQRIHVCDFRLRALTHRLSESLLQRLERIAPQSRRGEAESAKEGYWRWPQRQLAGNAIDFFIQVLGLSFNPARARAGPCARSPKLEPCSISFRPSTS